MTAADLLPDRDARRRASQALDETVFVSAGAGAGKTRVLVDRICALVTTDAEPVPMRSVAAVTFTEKAAAEMRDRVRAELSRRVHDPDEVVARRARDALDELDLAAIGTLHSFARRLLTENPIEARLPPVIRPLDEVASGVRSERWWSEIRTRLLEEPSTGHAMQVLLASGVGLDALREVTMRLQSDWDLVQDRCATTPPVVDLRLDLDPLRSALDALLRRAEDECDDPEDRLKHRISSHAGWFADIERAVDDLERLRMLRDRPGLRRVGSTKHWHDVDAVRAAEREVFSTAAAACDTLVHAALAVVVAAVAAAVLAEADQRRRDGDLQFQDLLVQARTMLRDSPEARQAAHRRYRRLLLDEFQDTDPLQIEIAVRIAAGAAGGAPDWRECPVPAGALFVVGDPKQSIYRFRRADIATFMEAEDHLAASGPAVLSTNFRSHPQVLAWVNHCFGRLIAREPGGQPGYEPLQPDPDRVAFHADEDDPRVRVVAVDPVPGKPSADELRAHEARHVAAAVAALLHERPAVEHRAGDQWQSRELTPADVCVLVPARTALEPLERELDRLNVPYRTEASSLVYRSDEVRDLLLTARAVDDPTDRLALVAALRTPLFGCGDDDLVSWRAGGGSFAVHARTPEGVEETHPVAEALAFLRPLARRRSQMSPSELLATIVADRQALEVATVPSDSPRYRETWRRLRYVVDQARAWSEAEHGSLRDFLDWARRQAEEEERANEIVLPERDVDAIRILTIHAAKGLEFPVVVLSGLASEPKTDPGRLVWPVTGPPEVSLRADSARSAGWDEAADHEKRMLHLEALRLLYVAATRAESRLVVSLARKQREGGPPADPMRMTRAELLATASQGAAHVEPARRPEDVEPLDSRDSPVSPPMPWEEWVGVRTRARDAARRREADSATDIAKGGAPLPEGLEIPPGLLKEPRDLELPAWLKGRYGAAVGRAVHATLQTVELSTGDGLDGIADAQALAEGVTDRAGAVRALARSGWQAPSVRRAADREHHKETYVGTTVGGQLVEGYIDLLYRDDDGSLVVIDYKTDADPAPQTVQAYRTQLAVYARALADATGDRIARCVLVFCREDAAVEADVPLVPPAGGR